MYKQIKKQPNMFGIAAGNIATVRIPTSGVHHTTFMRVLTAAGVELTRAQILNDIGAITVRINGVTKVDATALFLLDLQKYYGDSLSAGNDNGIIPIYWARRKLPSDAERSVYAIGLSGVDQSGNQITSFTIDAAIVAVAQVSIIEVYSEVVPDIQGQVTNLGQHVTISKFPQAFATTGLQEIMTLPIGGPSYGYLALHIENGTGAGVFTKVNVKIGGNSIYEDVPPLLAASILKQSGRTPQTNYYHVAFDRSNDLLGFLPMAGIQDFRQQITWATNAPNNFNIYAERVEGLRTSSGS